MHNVSDFFVPDAHVKFDFWEEYVEISSLDHLGVDVKRSGEMSVVITSGAAASPVQDKSCSCCQLQNEEEKSFVTACNRTGRSGARRPC